MSHEVPPACAACVADAEFEPKCRVCGFASFLLIIPVGDGTIEERASAATTCMFCAKLNTLPLIRSIWKATYWDAATEKLYR